MDKVDIFLTKQNLRIERLKKRLDIKTNPAPPDQKETKKKKSVTNKKTKYMLIFGFVICVITFLYFYSSFYITINPPEFNNPFEGEADYLDFVNFK